MSGITTCFRFPSDVNSDLRKLAVNMIPFPKLHFFMPGFAPLVIRSVNPQSRVIPIRTLARGMFDPSQMLVDCNPRGGRYLTVAVIFRGMFSVKEVEQEMSDLREKNKSFFAEWLANNMKISICEVPSRGLSESATIVGNSTSITEVFKRVLNQYDIMLRRKAFLHWYTGEGMEEDEFRVAEQATVDLIADYEQYQSP